MGRGTLSAIVAATFVGLFAGCWFSSGDSQPTGTGRPDGGPLCRVGHSDCASGFACVNGDCVPTCPAGNECPAGSYCEGPAPRDVCAPNDVTACVKDVECPLPQICFSGLCSTSQLRADGGYEECVLQYPNDACAADAICLQTQTTVGTQRKSCIGMPACSQDGSCPPGGFGSVCNDTNPDGGQLIPGKQRICLIGLCTSATNCPQSPTVTQCFRKSNTIPYGECQTGGTGDPCFTNTDCPLAPGGCKGADGGYEDGGTPGLCACADGGTPPCQ